MLKALESDILLARGLTSRLQKMEHHEQVVLQGQSTRHGIFVLLQNKDNNKALDSIELRK